MPEFLKVCEQAARAGGAVLLDWAERFSVREKGPADLVTEADVASQEAIRKIVLAAFPDHDFLSEEEAAGAAPGVAPGAGSEAGSAGRPSGRYRWIVDPLDGTTNYVHRVQEYAVSIALERDGQVLAGTVFNPANCECYTASSGGGAFLNGRRLHVSTVTDLPHALVTIGFPPKVDLKSPSVTDFLRLLGASQSIRRIGSAALSLCYLAAGRFDGYCARETKSWDVAAGWLLVQEAGGLMTDPTGSPFCLDRPQFITAATESLHQQMIDLLAH
jgi:myo-inositol-1(or 4)-monophosphatase